MDSDKITASAIEANDFPELSRRFRVMAVPRTVINEKAVIEGAMPESIFVRQIMNAVQPKPAAEEAP